MEVITIHTVDLLITETHDLPILIKKTICYCHFILISIAHLYYTWKHSGAGHEHNSLTHTVWRTFSLGANPCMALVWTN